MDLSFLSRNNNNFPFVELSHTHTQSLYTQRISLSHHFISIARELPMNIKQLNKHPVLPSFRFFHLPTYFSPPLLLN